MGEWAKERTCMSWIGMTIWSCLSNLLIFFVFLFLFLLIKLFRFFLAASGILLIFFFASLYISFYSILVHLLFLFVSFGFLCVLVFNLIVCASARLCFIPQFLSAALVLTVSNFFWKLDTLSFIQFLVKVKVVDLPDVWASHNWMAFWTMKERRRNDEKTPSFTWLSMAAKKVQTFKFYDAVTAIKYFSLFVFFNVHTITSIYQDAFSLTNKNVFVCIETSFFLYVGWRRNEIPLKWNNFI